VWQRVTPLDPISCFHALPQAIRDLLKPRLRFRGKYATCCRSCPKTPCIQLNNGVSTDDAATKLKDGAKVRAVVSALAGNHRLRGSTGLRWRYCARGGGITVADHQLIAVWKAQRRAPHKALRVVASKASGMKPLP
jgi:hypothetical protein